HELAQPRRSLAPAALRRRDERTQIEALARKRCGRLREIGPVQRGLTRQDAPIAQRGMAHHHPMVVGGERNHDRLATEGVPPDAEKAHRSDLEYGWLLGVERTMASLALLDGAIRADAVAVRSDRAVLRVAVIQPRVASADALQVTRDRGDLV